MFKQWLALSSNNSTKSWQNSDMLESGLLQRHSLRLLFTKVQSFISSDFLWAAWIDGHQLEGTLLAGVFSPALAPGHEEPLLGG